MNEFYYPPKFGQWPAEARGNWYGVNATREEVIWDIRDVLGIEDVDEAARLQKPTIAAAVEQLTDGDRVLRVDNSKGACLAALVDEADLDDVTAGKLTTEQLGIVLSELRERFPSSPHRIGLLA